MSKNPLVTVICLCYNHEDFVTTALNSVINQTHQHIELIIVDDCSTDNSVEIIEKWNETHNFTFIKNPVNTGNTKSFNKALSISKGEYIIDLAADDVLLQNSVAARLDKFNTSAINNLGVVYCNVESIDRNGNHLEYHFSEKSHKLYGNRIPEVGDLYNTLVSHYLINATSLLVKKEVFNTLKGYDESLSYEDFDFWIRSSRLYNYDYVDDVLVQKRYLENSLGKHFKKQTGYKLNASSLKVCKKIYRLNKTKEEDLSFKRRIIHELKITLKLKQFKIAFQYIILFLKTSIRVLFK